jgi:pyruvate dehydrogenase E1 component
MLCKGFLLGGTSGRTTLNGEGVQHQDGHSHLLAATVPNLKSYDPAFGYEIALIVRDGIRRMYQEQEDVFYYLTVTNQPYPMPAMPDGVESGVLAGMYCLSRTPGACVNLFGSGAIMTEVLRARELLEARGHAANVWSVTSYSELTREALAVERRALLDPAASSPKPYVARLLEEEQGVFVAASDYMKALPLGIAPWVPGRYVVLGTDGFGLSEGRPDLRDHFEVSAAWIAYAALVATARDRHDDRAPGDRFAEACAFADEHHLDLGKIDPSGFLPHAGA